MPFKMKLTGSVKEDLPKRCLSMSIPFELTRGDVFEIIGKDIILETDPDMSEATCIEEAEKQIAEKWTGKGKLEKTLRQIMFTDGISHKWDDYSLKEEDIRIHRPRCAALIDQVIDKYLPDFNITEREIEHFNRWKAETQESQK